METLEHNGVIFTKATVLAKRLGYTTDYIGQLCRAGKVEAKLVGRAWFVREDALLNHKADRYKSVRPAEILLKHNGNSYDVPVHTAEKVQVYPRLSKHLHRSFELGAVPVSGVSAAISRTDAAAPKTHYDSDSGTLHPEFHYLKEVIEPAEEVEVAEAPMVPAHKISIRNETARPKKLYFEPLAEVSLSGDLKIQNLDAEGSYTESEPVALDDLVAPLKQRITPRIPVAVEAVPVVNTPHGAPIVARVSRPTSFTPSSAASVPVDKGIPFFIPVVFVTSVAVTVLMLSLSGFVESDGTFLNQSLRFNMVQVAQAFSALR